jgi:hypothetical protein
VAVVASRDDCQLYELRSTQLLTPRTSAPFVIFDSCKLAKRVVSLVPKTDQLERIVGVREIKTRAQ